MMPGIHFQDGFRDNPLRPADWRWQRANWIVSTKGRLSQKRDDEHIRHAVCFQRQLQRVGADLGYRRLMKTFPGIVVALKCFEGDPLVRLELECRILGRQPPELIAEHLEMPVSVVETYKRLLFDVDDRIDATSHIANQVIGMVPCGTVAPEKHMKLSVYTHGPAAIEPWLDFLRHRDETHDLKTFQGWQRDSIDLYLKAQELPYVGEDAEQLVKCAAIVFGNWKKTGVLRSVSSVFEQKALQMLARVKWPEPVAEVREAAARQTKTGSRSRMKNLGFSRAI